MKSPHTLKTPNAPRYRIRGSFGPSRFVLLTNGEIVQMNEEELVRRVQQRIDDMDSADQKKIGHE